MNPLGNLTVKGKTSMNENIPPNISIHYLRMLNHICSKEDYETFSTSLSIHEIRVGSLHFLTNQ